MNKIFLLVFSVFLSLSVFGQDNSFNEKPWDTNKNYPIVIDPFRGNDIDFDKLITDKRVAGVIHKSSQGLLEDSKYVTRSQISKSKNLLFGSYHLGTNDDPIKQADFYLKVIKNNTNELMSLDIEAFEKSKENPKAPYMPLENAVIFIRRIYEKINKYPSIYINGNVFRQISAKYDKTSVFAKCPLWYAHFPIAPKPLKLPNLSNKVWDKVSLWQFSSELNCKKTGECLYNVPGTKYDMDVNIFNGSVEDLNNFWVN